MAKIFISYRRKDSPYVSSAIYRKLVDSYGRDNVFKDVDSIPLGVNFKDYIQKQIEKVNLLLVVIGDRWLSISDNSGNRRIDRHDDLVRLEIESALERDIPIIPIFVNNSDIPSPIEIPDSIRPLVMRNGISVRPDPDFDTDISRLLTSIELLFPVNVASSVVTSNQATQKRSQPKVDSQRRLPSRTDKAKRKNLNKPNSDRSSHVATQHSEIDLSSNQIAKLISINNLLTAVGMELEPSILRHFVVLSDNVQFFDSIVFIESIVEMVRTNGISRASMHFFEKYNHLVQTA